MKSRLALLFLFLAIVTAQAQQTEYIIVVGGPSLHQWEQYKSQPHDHWWANFVHSARIRTEQILAQVPPNTSITWMVYKPGYIDRGKQENQGLDRKHQQRSRQILTFNLIYFDHSGDVINYLNHGMQRDQVKVSGFEYFGHSNKACFLFDYSNVIESASKAWMHESELKRIDRRDFARNAYVKSWGCHTGESMSKLWREATGTKMWGAIGKTDFSTGELPALSSVGGKWVY